MIDQSTRQHMQSEAALRASIEHRVPLVFWPEDDVEEMFRHIPNLGEYTAPGWRPLRWDELPGINPDAKGHYGGDRVLLFIDSSGFASDDEPALSFPRAVEDVKAIEASTNLTVGWAIWEVGQFQVHVAAFAKES